MRAHANGRISAAASRGIESGSSANGHTIIVVDDGTESNRAFVNIAQQAGFLTVTISPENAAALDEPCGDCMLLPFQLPGMGSLKLQRTLKARGYTMPIVFLASAADVPHAVQAMLEGATDFLLTSCSETEFLSSITQACRKGVSLRQSTVETENARGALASLTARERDVLAQIVTGKSNKIAAYALGISPRTVEVHRLKIMRKLKANSVATLVRLATLDSSFLAA